ncbi:hypothetical protein BGX38DRAFT_1244434, partial [Terfezia claveryi]
TPPNLPSSPSKKPFLDSQIRLLSADLAPPPNWQDAIPAGPGGDLVNLIAKKHNRSVYSSQTVKRVAEQIEAAYGGAGGGRMRRVEVDTGRYRGRRRC